LSPLASVARLPVADRDTSLNGLRRRLEDAGGEFVELACGIRDRQAWDTAFVDATCEPPESFTFGGAVAHVLSWDSYRRQVLAGALNERGIQTPGLTDPMHFGED
jgi:AraC family transcriptional regulator